MQIAVFIPINTPISFQLFQDAPNKNLESHMTVWPINARYVIPNEMRLRNGHEHGAA